MNLVAGVAALAGGLLLFAASQKVVDPSPATGALRAMGLRVRPGMVRSGAAVEGGVGAAALVVGGPWLPALVAASYAAFAVFVAVALRRGLPISSCGCVGRVDTPPSPVHIGLDLVLGAAAAVQAVDGRPPVDILFDGVGASIAAVVLLLVTGGLAVVAMSRLPATLRVVRDVEVTR